ncbi:MAG TPA: hypothetical protein VKN16_21500 [Methylomirabilota bacterium]|jgi:hypothetical protein|nr:hypothetical protein [Methylomirabilota bacterium]
MSDGAHLCKDCTWYSRPKQIGLETPLALCVAPTVAPVDVVEGGVLTIRCRDARKPDGTCGPSGLFWEPKP